MGESLTEQCPVEEEGFVTQQIGHCTTVIKHGHRPVFVVHPPPPHTHAKGVLE